MAKKLLAPSLSLNSATARLAQKLLGWRIAPGRFLKPGGCWCPQWRFQPFVRIADAYLLLECAERFNIQSTARGNYSVTVQISGRRAKGKGSQLASVITTAIARALGVEI